jgi:hypothetical protein
MKKLVTLAVLSLSALLIVLPVIFSVNHSTSNSAPSNGVLRADGQPLPPFPPLLAETLVADGQPLPPFPPLLAETLTLA